MSPGFIISIPFNVGPPTILLPGVWRFSRREFPDCPRPGAPLLAFEKWPAENRNRALWRQHRGPLLKKREKWRTPRLCYATFYKTLIILSALIGPTRHVDIVNIAQPFECGFTLLVHAVI